MRQVTYAKKFATKLGLLLINNLLIIERAEGSVGTACGSGRLTSRDVVGASKTARYRRRSDKMRSKRMVRTAPSLTVGFLRAAGFLFAQSMEAN